MVKEFVDAASWIIPISGRIPELHPQEQRKLSIVKYGGRRWDKGNFIGGCKALMDELVARGLLRNDTEQWLDDRYYQVTGTGQRLEVVFHT